MTAKASVLVVGSSNTDLVIKMERLPKPGETMLGGKFVTSAGGKGANQAVSAARAGAAVTFIARIGRDNFGDKAIAGLAAEGINVKYMVRDEAHPSGVALILVDRAGENTIAVAPGSNGQLSTADLHKARSAFLKASVLLLQLETPLETVEAAAEMAASAGARIILNPAPAQALPGSLLRRVFVLTPNETETALLTGVSLTNEESRKRAARILFSRGVQNVIFTLGSRGVYVARKDSVRMIPGYKVAAVDATAAGDVFNGALAQALSEGKSILDAAGFANAAAAIAVTRLGAQSSAPTRADIERLLAPKIPISSSQPNGSPSRAPWKKAARLEI